VFDFWINFINEISPMQPLSFGMLNFFANIFLMSATIICQREIKKHGYDRVFNFYTLEKKVGQTEMRIC